MRCCVGFYFFCRHGVDFPILHTSADYFRRKSPFLPHPSDIIFCPRGTERRATKNWTGKDDGNMIRPRWQNWVVASPLSLSPSLFGGQSHFFGYEILWPLWWIKKFAVDPSVKKRRKYFFSLMDIWRFGKARRRRKREILGSVILRKTHNNGFSRTFSWWGETEKTIFSSSFSFSSERRRPLSAFLRHFSSIFLVREIHLLSFVPREHRGLGLQQVLGVAFMFHLQNNNHQRYYLSGYFPYILFALAVRYEFIYISFLFLLPSSSMLSECVASRCCCIKFRRVRRYPSPVSV